MAQPYVGRIMQFTPDPDLKYLTNCWGHAPPAKLWGLILVCEIAGKSASNVLTDICFGHTDFCTVGGGTRLAEDDSITFAEA